MNKDKADALIDAVGISFKYEAGTFVNCDVTKDQLYELIQSAIVECADVVDAQYRILQHFGVQR